MEYKQGGEGSIKRLRKEKKRKYRRKRGEWGKGYPIIKTAKAQIINFKNGYNNPIFIIILHHVLYSNNMYTCSFVCVCENT